MGTCSNAELEISIANPLATYTLEDCNIACLHNGQCVDFSFGKKYESESGKCRLYGSGCEKLDNPILDFYKAPSKNAYCQSQISKVSASIKQNTIEQLQVFS